jgi:hypothetical protein
MLPLPAVSPASQRTGMCAGGSGGAVTHDVFTEKLSSLKNQQQHEQN